MFNPLPNGKILDLSNLKTFADDNLNMVQMIEFVFDRVET